MVNNHSNPHKTNGTVQSPDIEEAVRQAVQGAIGAAFPNLYRIQGNFVMNITVNIHVSS